MRESKMEADNMLIWLGTGIAQRRKEAGLTCGQLARKVRLKTNVIHDIEAGEYELTVRQMYAIFRAVDVTLGEMFQSG